MNSSSDGAIVPPLPPSMTQRLLEASKTTPCGAPKTALLSCTRGFSSCLPPGRLANSTTLAPLATPQGLAGVGGAGGGESRGRSPPSVYRFPSLCN